MVRPRFTGPGGGPAPWHDGNAWWVHGLFTLLVVAVIVVGVILIVRLLTQRRVPPSAGGHRPAVGELDLRYARGEVDRTEYLQRRADLLGLAPPAPSLAAPGPSATLPDA